MVSLLKGYSSSNSDGGGNGRDGGGGGGGGSSSSTRTLSCYLYHKDDERIDVLITHTQKIYNIHPYTNGVQNIKCLQCLSLQTMRLSCSVIKRGAYSVC